MKIVAIDGLMGSGKSTVLKELERRGYTVFTERTEDWTFLSKFYENPKKYALSLQIQIALSFLKHKFPEGEELVFVERCPEVSKDVFGKMLVAEHILSDEDHSIYSEIFERLNLWKAGEYIFLECPIDECMNRIKRRGDNGIDEVYLKNLKKYYDIFFRYNKHSVVDSNKSVEEIADDIISLISSSS
jgi:NADH dehydrogenase (ubiquinone) 1 alpha subcomplex subunit 10